MKSLFRTMLDNPEYFLSLPSPVGVLKTDSLFTTSSLSKFLPTTDSVLLYEVSNND